MLSKQGYNFQFNYSCKYLSLLRLLRLIWPVCVQTQLVAQYSLSALGDPICHCCSAYIGTSQLHKDICLEEDKPVNSKRVNNHELNNQEPFESRCGKRRLLTISTNIVDFCLIYKCL